MNEKTQKTLKILASVLCLVGAIGLVVVLARALFDSRSFPVAFFDRAPLIAAWFTAIAVGTLTSVRFTKSTSPTLVILITLLLDLLLLTATADDVKLWRVGALMVSLVLVTIGALTTRGTPRSRLALRFVIAATVPFCLVVGVRLLGGDLPWF